MVKFGNCSQIAGDPPTLATLATLADFPIGYLGLLDHEMDFEITYCFPSQKWLNT